MKYFLTEAERKQGHGTCFFEFQRGENHSGCWLNDSLCLHADIFDEMKLYELFSKAIPHFSYYGVTLVSQKDWQILLQLSREYGGIKEEVICELVPWVEDCFKTEEAFTICGI